MFLIIILCSLIASHCPNLNFAPKHDKIMGKYCLRNRNLTSAISQRTPSFDPPYADLIDEPEEMAQFSQAIRDEFMVAPCQTIDLLGWPDSEQAEVFLQSVAQCQVKFLRILKNQCESSLTLQNFRKNIAGMCKETAIFRYIKHMINETYSQVASMRNHINPEIIEKAALFFTANIIKHGYQYAIEQAYVVPGYSDVIISLQGC